MTVDISAATAQVGLQRDDAAVIQAAIDRLASDGGGRVRLSGGRFRSGPLELKSGVELCLEAGAVLSFIPEFERYVPVRSRWEGVECWAMHPLVYAFGAERIALTGRGVLDGCGRPWWDAYRAARAEGRKCPATEVERRLAALNPEYPRQPSGGGGRELQFLRPPLVQFVSCTQVVLRDLTLTDSPFWNTHLVYCSDIEVTGVRFRNPYDGPNTDGLNLDSCARALVSGCEFDVGDDCLGLKSGAGEDGLRVGRPTEDVTIRDCVLQGGHGGVVVGSETAGGVRRVRVSSCSFLSTDRGLRIKTRRGRGGTIEDLELSDCRMENVLCPVVVNCYYGCGGREEEAALFSLAPEAVAATTPAVRNIRIRRLQAEGCRAAAAFLVGLPERPVEELELEDCRFTLSEGGAVSPDQAAMSRGLPAAEGRGIRLRNARGVRMRSVEVRFPEESGENTTPVLVETGVEGTGF